MYAISRTRCIVCLVLFILAVTLLTAETASIPHQILDWQKSARDSAAQGNTAQAVSYCQQIIQTDPNASYALEAQRQIVTVYVQTGKIEQAKTALTELKQNYAARPEYVKQVHEIGWDFVQKGDYATGLQVYKDLQTQFPNHERAVWFQRSVVQTYLEQGDIDKLHQAVEDLKNNYQSHPDYANQMATTAARLRSKKQYSMAAGIYDTLLQRQPANDQAPVWKRMQIVNALDTGQTEKAKAEVEMLFATYKDKAEFVKQAHELSWDFVQKQDYSTALKIYTGLREQFPNHERAAWFQRSIAQAYFEQGDTRKALQAVEQLKTNFQSHPDYVDQMEKLVGVLVNKQQPAAARSICETLLEKFPNHLRLPWFLQAKARSEVWMKDPNSADMTLAAMRQQCIAAPDYSDAMSWTAYEYRRAGYYQRSIELYESLLSQNPSPKVQVRSIASIAQAYARLGEDAKVREKVEQLLSQYVQSQLDGVAFYVFGIGEEYCLVAEEAAKTGNPNHVKTHYQKALAVWQRFEQAVPNHNSPQYAYFSGIACQRLGQYEQAVVHFQRVISKWPSYEQTWHARYSAVGCMDALKSAGKIEASQADTIKRALYQEILQRNPECPVVDFVRQTLNSQAQ